ncbi:Anp1-domain-containing protein [Terfezia claveryi]|nr:Anp1-domain-containing protein [Terfezia claveryi]
MPVKHAHAYSNGHVYGNTFSISPHRFQPRTQPALRWRRQLVVRILGIAFVSAIILLLIFPSFRYFLLPKTPSQFTIVFRPPPNFTYPHHLIDLAFLVSDSKDRTLLTLVESLEKIQADPDPTIPYGEISVFEKDFGQKVQQDVTNRHGFAAQASRRKLMARARNWLLSAALQPYHTWVYWRDVDDVIVPRVRTALALADTLDEDAVIVEGYAEYATWRPHLAYLRDPYGDPDVEMEIDGVGGVSILAKAKVFRSGVHFPAFSFEKHAETEGFGKMAKRMKFSVIGLPHYTIWHLYEPSADDQQHMVSRGEKKAEAAAKAEEEAKKRLHDGWELKKSNGSKIRKRLRTRLSKIKVSGRIPKVATLESSANLTINWLVVILVPWHMLGKVRRLGKKRQR